MSEEKGCCDLAVPDPGQARASQSPASSATIRFTEQGGTVLQAFGTKHPEPQR